MRTILNNLRALTGKFETIVVDGSSSDRTVNLVQDTDLDVEMVQFETGRAQQMNQGASKAKGDILLFLHADSVLPTNAIEMIENAMVDDNYVGGGFKLAINNGAFSYKLIAYFSNLRVKFFGHFFGDQAIFIRREIFQELGGFRNMELMEDMDFSRRAKKKGKMIQLSEKVITSARRWENNGVWRTIWLMQKIKFLYLIGVHPGRLSQMYPDAR